MKMEKKTETMKAKAQTPWPCWPAVVGNQDVGEDVNAGGGGVGDSLPNDVDGAHIAWYVLGSAG